MNIILLGTNHRTSPIALRERISFSKKRLKDALSFLMESSGLSGSVILSTCNRVEIYASCKEPNQGFSQIEDFLSVYHEIDKSRLRPYLYKYVNEEAVTHLFCVASGLDSQILGETEIQGQVKAFFEEARRAGATDMLLDGVYNKALEAGKKVRIETKISRGNLSIGSVAIDLIKKEAGSLSEKKILVIGAGEISESALRYLNKEKARSIFISNRTLERACLLAASINAKVVRFDNLKQELIDADIIITATGSPHTILRKQDLLAVKKPLLIIDLALPRDVEPEVKHIKGVSLFCLDDLNSIIENNLKERIMLVPSALKIIGEEVKDLCLAKILGLEPEKATWR